MAVLALGLLIFLGVHSIRIVAEPWRNAQIAHWGVNGWKARYSLASIVGFVLIIWGYGLARSQTYSLWSPPLWGRHLTFTLTAVAFVLFAASHVPGNRIKAVIGHPMVAGVALWALAHLLAKGTPAALVLFGAFLGWAVVDFVAASRREPRQGLASCAGGFRPDAIAVVAGLAMWAVFAWLLHGWLIGVRLLG